MNIRWGAGPRRRGLSKQMRFSYKNLFFTQTTRRRGPAPHRTFLLTKWTPPRGVLYCQLNKVFRLNILNNRIISLCESPYRAWELDYREWSKHPHSAPSLRRWGGYGRGTKNNLWDGRQEGRGWLTLGSTPYPLHFPHVGLRRYSTVFIAPACAYRE